jgi:hypothetical protein
LLRRKEIQLSRHSQRFAWRSMKCRCSSPSLNLYLSEAKRGKLQILKTWSPPDGRVWKKAMQYGPFLYVDKSSQ